jgi:hypothetical protein
MATITDYGWRLPGFCLLMLLLDMFFCIEDLSGHKSQGRYSDLCGKIINYHKRQVFLAMIVLLSAKVIENVTFANGRASRALPFPLELHPISQCVLHLSTAQSIVPNLLIHCHRDQLLNCLLSTISPPFSRCAFNNIVDA